MPAPIITALPDAPSVADPANFPTEASAHVASLAGLVSDVNAFGTYLNSGGFDGSSKLGYRSTYGGTADVITITTGLSLASLTTGLELRFRATAANTGATTINVDGLGAVTSLTITSAALPADYIRTDVDTVIRYDGTNWIADRQIERGSNANGDYIRWADGTQISYTSISIGSPSTWSGSSGSYYTTGTWTYPAAFIETPYITCSGDQQQSLASSIANIIITVRRRSSNTTTAAQWGAREVRDTNSANGALMDLHANGLWY